MPLPFLILFGILAISCIGGLITEQIFFSRLRRLHHPVWEQLGRPVVFLNSGFMNVLSFLRYMWRREYESLNDSGSVSLGRFLRGLFLFYFIYFGLFVLGIAFTIVRHKPD